MNEYVGEVLQIVDNRESPVHHSAYSNPGYWGNGEMGRRVYECSDEWVHDCMVVWFQEWHLRKNS